MPPVGPRASLPAASGTSRLPSASQNCAGNGYSVRQVGQIMAAAGGGALLGGAAGTCSWPSAFSLWVRRRLLSTRISPSTPSSSAAPPTTATNVLRRERETSWTTVERPPTERDAIATTAASVDSPV